MPVRCQNGLKTCTTVMCMKENMHAVVVQALCDRHITFPVRYWTLFYEFSMLSASVTFDSLEHVSFVGQSAFKTVSKHVKL